MEVSDQSQREEMLNQIQSTAQEYVYMQMASEQEEIQSNAEEVY